MPERVTFAKARAWLKRRPKNAHKGTSGRVLILAGSRGMVGAGILSAYGAVRSGAGLVKLATVKSQQMVAAKRGPLEATTFALPEDTNGRINAKAIAVVKRLIRDWRPDVIACGPGLGQGPGVRALISALLQTKNGRLVFDADALNVFSKLGTGKNRSTLVITPHVGELARLLHVSPHHVGAHREESAKKAATKFHAICLLKGPGTIVTDGKKVLVNTTGNPAMATGGMGDVLTGIVAATWAQGIASPLEATALAAYVHGLAADLAAKKFPERSMIASDVANCLPFAFRKLWRNI